MLQLQTESTINCRVSRSEVGPISNSVLLFPNYDSTKTKSLYFIYSKSATLNSRKIIANNSKGLNKGV